MKDLLVFVLRFEDRSAVERAFAVLGDEQAIESSIVELEDLRIRFLATKHGGLPLLERVYEQGGLVWCTRYASTALPEAD